MTDLEKDSLAEIDKNRGSSQVMRYPLSDTVTLIVPWKTRGKDEYLDVEITDGDHFRTEKVKATDLWRAGFLTANVDVQEALMPIETAEIRTYWKMVRIKLDKDMKAGEEVVAKAEFSIPTLELCNGYGTRGGYTVKGEEPKKE